MASLPNKIPPVVQNSKLLEVTDSTRVIHLAISLQVPKLKQLKAFVDSVSNPASPTYRHFLTPVQVGQQFGPSTAAVQQVVDYLTSKGFSIELVADSHFSILAHATVAQANAAFHTTISDYQALSSNVTGKQNYYCFTKALQVPASIAPLIQYVEGAENFTTPHRRLKHLRKANGPSPLTPTQTRVLYNSAPIYNSGFQGLGRTVAITSFDGYDLNNVTLWYQQYGLPTPAGGVLSNVTVTTIGTGDGSGPQGGEGDLDIQMVLGMAPLCHLIIYNGTYGDGTGLIATLTQEAQDNLADLLTDSYGYAYDTTQAEAAHTEHLQISAQGQTYCGASGDDGTDIAPEPYSYPDYDPDVLQVGGTVATFTATGQRITEVGWGSDQLGYWVGSAGGWVTSPSVDFNILPTWQKGKSVPTNINYRLIPDVALAAGGNNNLYDDPGAYYFFYGLALSTGDGTSFASPTFAGAMAISEEKLIAHGALAGINRFGRIADLIYSQNQRSDVWYDILGGANGPLPNGTESVAGPGWDFVTGWGPINFAGFVASELPTLTLNPLSAQIYDGQGQGATGGPAQLTAVDGACFDVASVKGPAGAMAAAQTTFQLSTNYANLSSVQIKVALSTTKAATNFLYAFNVNTNQYDLLSTIPVGTTNSSISLILNSTLGNYVDSSGTITVVDRALIPPRFGIQPFTLKIDQAIAVEAF